MSNAKKEVEFTPLNSTRETPKRASIRHKQLYQKNARNFKRLNIIKNFIIGILLASIVQITGNLETDIWYQVLMFYITTGILLAYILTQADKCINYMAGGSCSI